MVKITGQDSIQKSVSLHPSNDMVFTNNGIIRLPLEKVLMSLPDTPEAASFKILASHTDSNIKGGGVPINFSSYGARAGIEKLDEEIERGVHSIHLFSSNGLFGLIKPHIMRRLDDYNINSVSLVYGPSNTSGSDNIGFSYVNLLKIAPGTFLNYRVHVKPSSEVKFKPLVDWLESSVSGKLPDTAPSNN